MNNNSSSCSDEDIVDNNIEFEDNNEVKLYKTYYVDLLGGNIQSFLKKSKLTQFINNRGIDINDKRFDNNIKNLSEKISFKDFIDLMNSNIILFKKIFENDLIISDWEQLKNTINIIYNNTKNINSGKKADYIPQLNNVDENLYAISLCSVDGQIYNLGDTDYDFCVQSCSKPITYLIGCDLNSSEQIHNFVGTEPSGRNFNELCLNEHNIPHNPLINSGAIMCASLIDYENSLANRFDNVMKYWSKLAGNTKISFSTSVYLSERASADRNNCLAYMMQEKKAFSIGMNKKY